MTFNMDNFCCDFAKKTTQGMETCPGITNTKQQQTDGTKL